MFMKRILLAILAVGLVACGGEDDDCYDTVRAGGKTHCVPGPNANTEMCLINPEPKGLGSTCDYIRDICPAEHLILSILSTEGEVLPSCSCDPGIAEAGVCDGTPYPLQYAEY